MTVQDVDLQLYLAGVWTDVPLMATPVTITRGHDPYGSWPRPTRVECEIDNDDLGYDPSRPESTLYGVAGRNTKARIRPQGTTRVWAEASSWTPERTMDHEPGQQKGRSSTRLVAEGLLRRLSMWTDPLRSPMYRTIAARTTSIGHWSLEEGSGALSLANSLAGGPSGQVKGGVTLGDSEAPLGAEASAKVTTGSQMRASFASASTTAGWQIGFSFRLPSVPGSATYGELLRWTTSVGYTWYVEVNDTTFRWRVVDSTGTSLLSATSTFGGDVSPAQWVTMRIRCEQDGADVDIQPAWYMQGDTSELGITTALTGSVGALREWIQVGNTVNNGGWICHVFGVTSVADDLLSDSVLSSFDGYKGEPAGTRFARLCTELGITAYLIGSVGDTTLMGPQQADPLIKILDEIRKTDDCRIDDERLDIALTMTTRKALYEKTAALELTYPDDIAPPFRSVIDDGATRNVVTASNRAGGEYTVTVESGPMSTQAPPDGVGEYQHTVDVSVEDPGTQLDDIAHWHAAKGTIERARYESVTVDLVASPALATDATAVREGDLITIDGAEAELVRLLVVGIEERVTSGTWTITYQTEMYDPYVIGEWDDAGSIYDAATSTLNADYDDNDTALVLTCTDVDDVWSTSFTGDLMIGGERVTVSSMGAASGSGPYTQTATVTRSVNGVVKAQTAGTPVHVADAKRWGL